VQTSSIIGLFKRLIRLATSHIRALGRGEEGYVAQVVDLLLPLLACLICWINVFDTVAFTGFDHIRDPSALHLNGSRSIGE